MTFIISAATRNIALQVADTRLTRVADGTIKDDLSIKTTVLHCRDAKLIISFTGLASINGKRTNKWIEEKLVQFRAWEKVFQETMDYLRDEATNALSRDKNLEKHGLEIVVIGLGFSPAGTRQPAIALITNSSEPQVSRNQFVDVDPIGRPFIRYIRGPIVDRHYIGISGATGGRKLIINGLRRKLEKQLRQSPEGANPRQLLDRLVAILRLHKQDHPQLNQVIGSHCVAVAIMTDLKVVCVSYGPRGGKLLFPNFVEPPRC
jgi:hypothetical protein